MKKLMTLCIIHQSQSILLGMKKRGLGVGKWNGYGGKVAEGETIKEAACRELYEEAGVKVVPSHLDKTGVIECIFQATNGKIAEICEVHIFKADKFAGKIIETEEMRPQWFGVDELPYDDMWPDERHWFPLCLSGRKFRGKFLFDEDNVLLEQSIDEVRK